MLAVNRILSKPRIAAAPLFALALAGCFRVAPPACARPQQIPGGSAWVTAWAWGLITDDETVACPYGGVVELDSMVLVPVAVLTLGVMIPVHVTWTCELPRRDLEHVAHGLP
jgi:hypothetical protein